MRRRSLTWMVACVVVGGFGSILLGCTVPADSPVRITVEPNSGYAPLLVTFGGDYVGGKFYDPTPDPEPEPPEEPTPTDWEWQFGDGATATGKRVTHEYAEQGTFTARLTVTLSDESTHSATCEVEVSAYEPVANAGIDRTVLVGQEAWLDGSQSTDPGENDLTFAWSLVSRPPGSACTLGHGSATMCSIVPDQAGEYRVRLVVNNGYMDSVPDDAIIMAQATPAEKPIANAGPDQQVEVGNQVWLDGSASSDPLNYPITFQWSWVSKPEGSNAQLAQSTTELCTFTADVAGDYRVALVVSNGTLDSDPDEAVVTATVPENHAPIANAGQDETAKVGDEVWLDGSQSSDPDGDALTHMWTWVTGPELQTGTLSSASAVQPSFVAQSKGTYRLQLIVNDGELDSAPDEVSIVVTEEEHLPPVADAGPDQVLTLQDGQDEVPVALDGSGSRARQGTLTDYLWTGSPDPADVVKPTLTLHHGHYSFSLVVKDSLGQQSPSDSVSITIRRPDDTAVAIADAGDDIDVTLESGATTTAVTLDGSGSYVTAGNIVTYAWSGTPDPADVVNPSVTLSAGVYTFTLVVTGSGGEVSDADEVRVRVLSTENQAPRFISEPLAEAVQNHYYYYEAKAEDPEGGAVRYALGSAPAGMRIDEKSGLVTWTPSPRDTQSQSVEVFAYDPEDLSANQAYSITIGRSNLPPAIVSAPLRDARVGQLYTYTVVALDEDGDAIQYGLIDGQTGVSVQADSGLLSWTPTEGQVGRHWLTVSATDAPGEFDTQQFMVEVVDPNNPVAIQSPEGDYTVLVGETLQLALEATPEEALFSADPMPLNAHIDHDRGRFIFTPSASQEGWHPVAFSARLGDQWASSAVRIHVVREENHPPVIAAIPTQTLREGEQLTVPITASDPDDDKVELSIDGSVPANSVLDAIQSTFMFAPTYEQAGSYTVTVAATDGVANATQSFEIVVENVVEEATLDVAIDPPASPTFQVSQNVSGTVNGEAQPQPPAALVFITGLVPNEIRQAETKTIAVTGYNTEFVSGATTFDFGGGITVDAVNVTSATEASVTVTASTTATLGVRTVTVDHDGPDAYSVVGFTVREGAAVISGVIVDPFTQQPLAGARVTVMATGQYVITDADGAFRIEGAPSGEVELIVTMANYRANRFSVALGTNETLAIETPITLDALVRPFNPGGSMDRAATVPSVIDRGFCDIPEDVTIEQLTAMISDAYLSVGGTEVGVLDEAGNQLNSKIANKRLAYINLTPTGLRMQANAAQQRTMRRLGDVLQMFLDGFETYWTHEATVAEMVQTFRDAAAFAWAKPSHPNSGVVLLIFNNNTTLSVDPPLIDENTLLNPLQVSMLTNALLVANAFTLEQSIDEILIEQGIDPDAAAEEAFAMLREGQVWTDGHVWPAYTPPATASTKDAGTTIALPPNQMTNYDRWGLNGLTGGQHFSKFCQTVVKESLLKVAKDTLWGTILGLVVKGVFAYSMGSTAGVTGQAIGMTIYAAFEEAIISTIIEKVLIGGMLASIQDQLTPMPVVPVSSEYSEDGAYLFLDAPRSTSEGQSLQIMLPTGGLSLISAPPGLAVANVPMFKWKYELYLFDDLMKTDIIQAVPMLNAKVVDHPKDPDYLRFKIPVVDLRVGVNFLRIATVQYRDEVVYEKQREKELAENAEYLKKTYSKNCPSYVKNFLSWMFVDDTYSGTVDTYINFPADKRFMPGGEAQLWMDAEMKEAFGTTTVDFSGEAGENAKLDGMIQKQQGLLAEQQRVDLDFEQRKNGLLTQSANIQAMTESYAKNGKALDNTFWGEVERATGITPGDDLKKQVTALYGDSRVAYDSKGLMNQYQDTATKLSKFQGSLDGIKGNSTLPGITEMMMKDFGKGGQYSDVVEIGDNVGGTKYNVTVNYVDELGMPKQYTSVVDLDAGPHTEIGDLRQNTFTNWTNARDKIDTVDINTSKSNFAKNHVDQADFTAYYNKRNQLRVDIGAVDGEIKGQQKVISDLLDKKNRVTTLTDKVTSKTKWTKAFGIAMDVIGTATFIGETAEKFLQGIAVLRSELSAPHQILYTPNTASYPPYLTPYPDYELYNAYITTAPQFEESTGEVNPRGGMLRVNGMDHKMLFDVAAGFPAEFLVYDEAGWVYAVNGASTERYGGRIFRYDTQRDFSREFAGAIHYFNNEMMYAHPARPISSTVALAGALDNGELAPREHLFYPDVEYMQSMYQASANPEPRMSAVAIWQLALPGLATDNARRHLVAETCNLPDTSPIVFRFTGPTDIVAAPASESVQDLYVTDLGQIYRLRLNLEASTIDFSRADTLVSADGDHEWSGLALDMGGTLYIADYADGRIYFLPASSIRAWELSGYGTPLTPRLMNPTAKFNHPGDIEIAHDQRQLIVSTAAGPQSILVPHVLKFDDSSVSKVRVKLGEQVVNLPNVGDLDNQEYLIPMNETSAITNRAYLMVDYQDSFLGLLRSADIEYAVGPYGMQEVNVHDINSLAGNP